MSDIVDLLEALPPAITPEPVGRDLAAADVARGHRALRQRRRRLGTLAGAGAGTVVAVAVAVALIVTSAVQPTAPSRSAAQAPEVHSRLVSLAARITTSHGPRPGNASLEIVRETVGGKLTQVIYALFTDSGKLYLGNDKQTLMTAVARHANLADGADFREVAAARYAARGDLAIARVRMIDATPNDFFLSFAARKKIWAAGAAKRRALLRAKGIKTPLKMPTGKFLRSQMNNSAWINSTDALNWAGGDPEIRAGVLRVLSTIPEVTVADSTTGGQPTLTITAGPDVFSGDGKEVLIVSAKTGLPVSSVVAPSGVPAAVSTYRVSRVTLASIEAGKF
jgi:hypothetical protein